MRWYTVPMRCHYRIIFRPAGRNILFLLKNQWETIDTYRVCNGKFKDIMHPNEHHSLSLSIQHPAIRECYRPFNSKVSPQMHEIAPILTHKPTLHHQRRRFAACKRTIFESSHCNDTCCRTFISLTGSQRNGSAWFVMISASVIVLASSTCRLACCSSEWR